MHDLDEHNQGLMQVGIYSDNCHWAPKSRCPNSKKRGREKEGVIKKKKEIYKRRKESEKRNGANKNATETANPKINKAKKNVYKYHKKKEKNTKTKLHSLVLIFSSRQKQHAAS